MAKYNLSEAEYEIMEYIWKQNCMLKFSDIMEFLSEKGHEWRKQTVQTFLTRLIEKGVLKAQKDGNYRLYYPAMSEEEYISKWTKNIVKDAFGNSLKEVLFSFTGRKILTKEEAAELHDFIEQ